MFSQASARCGAVRPAHTAPCGVRAAHRLTVSSDSRAAPALAQAAAPPPPRPTALREVTSYNLSKAAGELHDVPASVVLATGAGHGIGRTCRELIDNAGADRPSLTINQNSEPSTATTRHQPPRASRTYAYPIRHRTAHRRLVSTTSLRLSRPPPSRAGRRAACYVQRRGPRTPCSHVGRSAA